MYTLGICCRHTFKYLIRCVNSIVKGGVFLSEIRPCSDDVKEKNEMNMKKFIPLLVIASMMLSMIPSIIALPAPTLDFATGNKGTTIKVTGVAGTVPAGTALQLYWDTTTGAWDGVKGLMNSTTAKASGAYEVWFKVPEATNGAHYVWIKDGGGNTASTAFTVTTKVKNSPASGLELDTIAGTFNGFSASKDLAVMLVQTLPVTVSIIGPGNIEVLALPDGVKTEYSGTMAHKFLVPGTVLIGVNGVEQAHDDGAGKLVDSASPLFVATGTINYATGAYTITFDTAPAGLPGIRTEYNYWGTSLTQFDLGKGTTNSVGTATISWKVPDNIFPPAATWNLVTRDAKGVTSSTTFSVGPVITLTPATGANGDNIAISGRGWTPTTSTITSIVLSRTGYTSACMVVGTAPVTVTVDLNGRFRANIIVPGAPKVEDDYTITVTSSDALVASADFEVTALHTLKVSPVFGPQGSQMTVSGTHYSKVVDTVVTVDLETTGGVLVVNIGTVKTRTI